MSVSIRRRVLAVVLIGGGTAQTLYELGKLVDGTREWGVPIDGLLVIEILVWMLPAAVVAAVLLWRYAGEAQGAPRTALRTTSVVCGMLGTSFVGVMIKSWTWAPGDPGLSDIASLLAAPALLLGLWLLLSGSRQRS